MKLYFPTSTLNFNDMLATESLSPKYFYDRRNYGTNRHFVTELSIDETFLTLFTSPPMFELAKTKTSEYEEYPMILELDIDENLNLEKINKDIYITRQTIYFNSESIKFRFFKEEHVKQVLIKSRLAEETKLVHKYKDNFNSILKEKLLVTPLIRIGYKKSTESGIKEEMDKDFAFNSFKGLIFALSSTFFEDNECKKFKKYIMELKALSGRIPFPFSEMVKDSLLTAEKYYERGKNNDNKISNIITEVSNDLTISLDQQLTSNREEQFVLDLLVNLLLKRSIFQKNTLSKAEMSKILECLSTSIQKELNRNGHEYIEDINNISDRIFNRNYDITIKLIKSNVMQNLFLFLLKNRNLDELEKMAIENAIDRSYLSYGFVGLLFGFSGLSKLVTNEIYSNDLLINQIEKQVEKVRKEIWSYSNNIAKVPDKLEYKEEISNDLYSNDLISMLKEENKDYNINSSIDIKIMNEIQRIRRAKMLKSCLIAKEIKLENLVNVKFEKTTNEVNIFFSKDNITLYFIKLRKPEGKNELEEFKKYLKLERYPNYSNIAQGNYPIIKYSKDDSFDKNLTNNEKKDLLACLTLLV